MTINWQNIIDRAHGMALEKGWWQPDANGKVRSLGECLTLIHSEISEACEAYREYKGEDGYEFAPCREEPFGDSMPEYMIQTVAADVWQSWKPVGIPSELADVSIRDCDLMGHWGLSFIDNGGLPFRWSGDFLEDLNVLHGVTASVNRYELNRASTILIATESIAAHYGIDLAAAIEAKLAYNATRPHRHGKRA